MPCSHVCDGFLPIHMQYTGPFFSQLYVNMIVNGVGDDKLATSPRCFLSFTLRQPATPVLCRIS